jgi:hypothetical protein
VIPPGLAAWASWLGSGNLTTKRSFLPPDRDVAIFGRALNYFISYYDHSGAKWRLWFDWKERAQDRECLRCKHKGNEYKHCCEFYARRFYENQSPFVILLRDLPAQVLKTLPELETGILRRDAHLFLTIRGHASALGPCAAKSPIA